MMRKHYFIFISLFILLINGISCGPKPDYGIKFDKQIFNFGIKDEGIEISHTFVFTNTGKQTLTIQDVKPTCGCTVAENWDKTVAPGKKGKIPITFKTTGYQGEVEKVINVITNVPGQESIQLTIKVNVISPIAIIPTNVWLGDVTRGTVDSLNGSFEIQNNLRVPIKILEITPPDKKSRVNLTTIEENKKYRVDFTVDPPFEGEEVVHGQFTVKTDNKKYEYLYPSFSYFMAPSVQIFPNVIYIDSAQLKENDAIRSINIKSNIEEPIKVLDLKFNGDKAIKYELESTTPGKYYLIKVTIPLGYTFPEDKQFFFTFRVENDPKNMEYNVPIQVGRS